MHWQYDGYLNAQHYSCIHSSIVINECQGQCHFSMWVEVSDWVPKSAADQCMQICVFQTRHGQQEIVLGLMYNSALPLRRQHIYGKVEQHRKVSH